ncbi:MAG: chromosome partitioning protein ParA [Chloroflexi bacterium HGW-Chloroflexi-1]|nr:MAG: chromosome partitioning protein ParA [Chloroflexi bacterium HGW-Chloroflexi-1]
MRSVTGPRVARSRIGHSKDGRGHEGRVTGMGRIIAIANQKGGVGKTTTTINLGAALVELGYRVLLVDLDPQAALSYGVGIQADNLSRTIYNALSDPGQKPAELVCSVRQGLDILPANIDLAAAEIELIPIISRETILKEALAPLVAQYSFILIDCGPNLGLLTINALTAADTVLIPMQCEYFALRAIDLLLRIIKRVQARLNPGLTIAGILGTLYQTGTRHADEVLTQARTLFGERVFDVVVKKSIRFAEASALSRSILEFAPDHEGAEAYRTLAEVMTHDNTEK